MSISCSDLFSYQDVLTRISGLQSFWQHLESIRSGSDEATTTQQQQILKEYLDSQVPQNPDSPFLPQFAQAWDFAAQSNQDELSSALPAVLALLLKTISSHIDFRGHGVLLCKTCLDQAWLKHVERALSAPKRKEHVVSPCLRLLTEIVCFDGGAFAKKVFVVKSSTFDGKILARNLALHKSYSSTDLVEFGPQSTVRSNAVRYLLANLKFQPHSVKEEIVRISIAFRSFFEYLKYDPPELIYDILQDFKNNVVLDSTLSRASKGYILYDHNLSNVVSLCRQDVPPSNNFPSEKLPANVAYEFLHSVCTDPAYGVLHSNGDWYPPEADANLDQGLARDSAAIDLGLDSVGWYNRYYNEIPVRNTSLSRFIQNLRPYANTYESDLLLEIFKAAPELVADYFLRKQGFTYDPKLTATWIGYNAFLFSVVSLPIPREIWRRGEGFPFAPPPLSIVIENILPKPITQKVLSRCLNQQCELIIMFAIRILTVAFEKLSKCLELFETAAFEQGELWQEAYSRLLAEFSARCASFKDVTLSLRRTAPDNAIQREASLRLIRLYHQITPDLVGEERFDVSTLLDQGLRRFEEIPGQQGTEGSKDVEFQIKDKDRLSLHELDHLLVISQRACGTSWMHKPNSSLYSPFTTLLVLVSQYSSKALPVGARQALESVLKTHDILQRDTPTSALSALLASLTPQHDWKPSEALLKWLDDVIGRLSRKPIKYMDDLEALTLELGQVKPVSLIWMTLKEQWPFLESRNPSSAKEAVWWLKRFYELSTLIGEDVQVLSAVQDGIERSTTDTVLRQSSKLVRHENLKLALDAQENPGGIENVTTTVDEKTEELTPRPSLIEPSAFELHSEDPSHSGLHRLLDSAPSDTPDSIAAGDLGSLLLCLSSQYSEVRQQVLKSLHSGLQRFSQKSLQSTYPPAQQLQLLVGIVVNTVTPLLRQPTDNSEGDQRSPIPSIIPTLASLLVPILTHPTHPLYEQINRFLLRGPTWQAARLPSYFIHLLLRTPPTEDVQLPSSHHKRNQDPAAAAEIAAIPLPPTVPPASPVFPLSPYHCGIHFLLSLLTHSLASPADLAILRKRNVFEPILSLFTSLSNDSAVSAAEVRGLRELVMKFLWRVTSVEGGSDTLVTRAGVVAWVEGRLAESETEPEEMSKGKDGREQVTLAGSEAMRQFLKRLWETCEQERVRSWSQGGVEDVLRRVVGVGIMGN